MKTSDFDYDLPHELIADYPLATRSSSRLLVYLDNREHKCYSNLVDYFDDGDLLVLNNTSVIPARLYGKKESGGNVEIFLERLMEDNQAVFLKAGGDHQAAKSAHYRRDQASVDEAVNAAKIYVD